MVEAVLAGVHNGTVGRAAEMDPGDGGVGALRVTGVRMPGIAMG